MVLIHAPIRQDQNIRTLFISAVTGHKQPFDRSLQRRALVVKQRDRSDFQPGTVHMPYFHQFDAGEYWVLDLQDSAVFRLFFEKVAGRAQIHSGVGHDLFPDRVDRGVRHLGEKLLEVAEQRLPGLRQYGKRDVGTHGGNGLRAGFRHRQDGVLYILIGITKGLVQLIPQLLAVLLHLEIGDRQILQVHQVGVQPFAVGALLGVSSLDFLVFDQTLLYRIDQQHTARLKAGFLYDIRGGQIQNANFGGENQIIIPRLIPAAGAKTVAVEYRTNAVSVRKDNGGRPVPGFQHSGIILIKVLFCLAHPAVIGPWFRDGHHDSLGKLDPVHHEKLQGVVQHGGI